MHLRRMPLAGMSYCSEEAVALSVTTKLQGGIANIDMENFATEMLETVVSNIKI